MLSLKQSKSRSFSKGIGKIDLDNNTYMQKTISAQNKEEPKRISSISIVSKNTPSKQIHRQNKQNNIDRETIGLTSNSQYIKSLYRKYLGKENEIDKGQRTMKPTESQSAIKQLKESTTLFGNTGSGMSKMNSYRESANKSSQPIRSASKKEVINVEKQKRVDDTQHLQLLELCDKQDSCIKAMLILKQARKRNNMINF